MEEKRFGGGGWKKGTYRGQDLKKKKKKKNGTCEVEEKKLIAKRQTVA